MSIEAYREAMLAEVDERYEKSVGYPAYDFINAFAFGCAILGDSIASAENAIMLDNMSGEYLEAFVGQRKSVYRKIGGNAEATLRIVSASGTVQIQAGYLFRSTSGLDFQAIDDGTFSQGDTFHVRAVDSGVLYNVAAGEISVIPYTINNLGSVTNDSAATGGSETETDEELRSRYMMAVENGANGTNAGSYEDWALSVPGIGYAKCYPADPAAGSCTLLIVDADGHPSASGKVAEVQAAIDPNGNGDGSGLAPMGAKCVVAAPTEQSVTVVCQQTEGTADTNDIKAAINKFFAEIALKEQTISYSKLLKRIMSVDGVEDVTLTINSGKANVEIDSKKVARAGVTVS